MNESDFMQKIDKLESLVYTCATECVDIRKGLFPIVKLKNELLEMYKQNHLKENEMKDAPKDGMPILVELENQGGFDIVRFDGENWVDKHGVCFGLEPIKWYPLPEKSIEYHYCADEQSRMKCFTNSDGGLNLSYEYPNKDGGTTRVITQVEICPFCGEQ